MSLEAKAVFSAGPMVSFRKARKTSSYLVRAKLYILERFVGSSQCKKRKFELMSQKQMSFLALSHANLVVTISVLSIC